MNKTGMYPLKLTLYVTKALPRHEYIANSGIFSASFLFLRGLMKKS